MYRKVWYTMVEEIDGQGPGATDMGNESDCQLYKVQLQYFKYAMYL